MRIDGCAIRTTCRRAIDLLFAGLLLLPVAPARAQGTCGVAGDPAVHRPLYYTGTQKLAPPALGATQFDIEYSCPFKRLSGDDCNGSGSVPEGPRPVNSDGSLVMVLGTGGARVVDLEGRTVRANFNVYSWNEPRWSSTDPNRIWFHSNPVDPSFNPSNPATYLNKVYSYDVATGVTTLQFTITPYTWITFGGGPAPGMTPDSESDVSPDGHIVVGGKTDTDPNVGFTKFRLLNLNTGAMSAEVTPNGAVDFCGVTPVKANLFCKARNNALNRDTMRLFDFAANPNPPEQEFLNFAGHGDIGVDTQDTNGDGSKDEIYVLVNGSIAKQGSHGCSPPGIEKVRLPDGQRTCILDPIVTGGAHVSLNSAVTANGGPSHPWALVSTYRVETVAPEGSLPANWTNLWGSYDNEILLVRLDGSEVRRLAHHRNRDDLANPFEAGESRAAINESGTLVTYHSNFAGSAPSAYLLPTATACNLNGTCESGENCRSCPSDCGGSPSCGNGTCEAIEKESCTGCALDCNGVTGGPPANRFCCGPVTGAAGYCSEDSRCTTGGFACTDDPLPGVTRCCGDGTCSGGEGTLQCQPDCGSGTGACPGGIVSGGSTVVCPQPRQIYPDGFGSLGDNLVGIPAFSPVNDFPTDALRNGFQQLCDIFGLRGTASMLTQWDAQTGNVTNFLCNSQAAPTFRPCQGVMIQTFGVSGPILGTIPVGKPGPGVEGAWKYRTYGDAPGGVGENLFSVPLTIASLSPQTLCQELNLPAGTSVIQILADSGQTRVHNCGQVAIFDLRPGEAVLIRAPGNPGQLVAEGSVTIN